MDGPLAWQNLIFLIPIAFGLLMFLGSAFGADGDHDHGHGGHDADHGHDGGKDAGKGQPGSNPLEATAAEAHGFSLAGSFLDLLGVGRVPLTVVLAVAGLTFGGAGYVGNILIGGAGIDPAYLAWVTIPVAFVAMTFLTGRIARVINRFMPSTESYNVTKQHLVGQVGTLTLPADAARGLAQVKDAQGNVFSVECRTEGPELQNGQEILVLEYVREKDLFLVQAYSSEKHDVV